MKKQLLLSILAIFSFLSLQAQNHYLLPNSVAGINIELRGNSGLTGQYRQAQSFSTGPEAFWFIAPAGRDNNNNLQQSGGLDATISNTTNQWIKLKLYWTSRSALLLERNLAPNSSFELLGQMEASRDWFWELKPTVLPAPVIVPDTFLVNQQNDINVLQNDLNIPFGFTVRTKANQTIYGSPAPLISSAGILGLPYTTTNLSNASFIYEVLNASGAVVGESTIFLKYIAANQFCLLDIVSLQLAAGSKDQYILITASPNSSITGPYNFTIKNLSTNTVVRSGQTPNPDVIYKTISFLNLPTASYEVKITAINKVCSAVETVYHIAANDACNIKVNYISKKGTTNTYEADVTFSEITTYKWESNYGTNAGQGGNNGNKVSFTLPVNTSEGDYTFVVRNEGAKVCSNASFFNHRNLQANTGALETYVKFITGKQDNWEIRGLSSEASGRDFTTQWRITDNRPNIIWQSYISDWQNLGQSASALASVGFQKDTARNEPAIWLSAFENRLELRQRTTKSGSVNVINTAYGVTFPLWLRLEKTGTNIVAKYSTTQSLFPIWTQIGSLANATPNWSKLLKTLSVGSGKPDVTSSARFQGQLGGNVNFGTTSTQTPTAPLIAKSIANPNQNDALTLSSSVCSNGSVVKWYKNQVFAGAGNTLAIIAIHNDAYYARCENGSIRSDSSNVIRFIYGTASCDNNLTAFSINTITPTIENNYAVAFIAANLSAVNVDIRNVSNVSVRNYDTPVTANPLIVDAGVLTTGTYTLKLTGKSCTGTTSKTFTVNDTAPTLSCNNNGTFSISSISQSGGQLYNVTYNASNLTNVEAIIKNSSNIAVRTITLAVSSNPLIVDIGTQSVGTYTLQLNGLSCVGSTANKTFAVTTNKPSCQNGATFSIASATYSAGSLTFQFNAANLSNATWTVRQGTTVISTGILSPITSSTNTVTTSSLSSGTYTLQLEGNSCTGVAIRQFTVGTVTTAPTLASTPTGPTTGDNISLTATGCTGNYNFFKNLEVNPFVVTVGTTQISNVQSPDYYYVQCAAGSLNSNYIQVSGVGSTGGGTTILSGFIFPNMFQSITPETANDTFGAEKFLNLTYPTGLIKGTFPKTFNNDLGFHLPNWINVLHTDMSLVYKNKGYNVIDDFGYLGSTDIRLHGTQGIDWELFPWGTFVTALPIERRVETYLGTMVSDFLTLDNAGVIQRGFQIANNTDFGNIVVNGKTQRIYTSIDSEGAGEDGSAGIRKPLLLFKTIFENTRGIVSYMYGTPIQSDLGYNTNGNGYADVNGNIPASMINPIFRDSEILGSGPYKLVDSKGLAPHGEISHYGESAYGNYNDGVRQLTVFGPTANNEHYLARVVEHNEKNYYAYKKLGGADLVMFQNKSICDRGSNGWRYNDGTRQNGGSKAAFTGYLKRDQVFKSQMASFFSGVHTVEWNRPPTGINSDSQNGIEEARAILNTEVIFSPAERISALKLRSGAFEFSLYNAEYKLQGESNFRKEKGYELKDTQDNLLVRFMKKGNYMVVFVCDPYNLATKKNLTVRWGSFEKTFTTADWASCYSDGSTKDYIFAIYNISIATPGSETGSIIAPTITKNVATPTAGQSVILTSSGCQSASYTTKWYDSAEGNLIQTSLTLTVNAQNGNGYFAKCVGTSNSSVASNFIVFNISTIPPPSGSITITEPAIIATQPYYFSNGHTPNYYDNNLNFPAIHKSGTKSTSNYAGKILSGIEMQSGYSMSNDLVWLQNDKVKVGINLLRGGQVAWFSTVNATKNLVYNGYDGGFQVTCDIYQKPDGYTQNGKTSRFQDNNTSQIASYNTTMGGDFVNNSQSLISYVRITNGYKVKFRPIFYTFNCEWSETTIEATYTLDPGSYAVKCEYIYTSFRSDNQYTGGGFDSSALPACFLVNDLTRYRTYTGGSPFTNANVDDGVVPINNENGRAAGAAAEPVKDAHTPERWSCVYNPNSSRKETFGIYIPTSNSTEYTKIKQFEVYAQNGNPQGSEFNGGFTYMDFTKDLTASVVTGIENRTNFTKTMTAYIIATETEGGTDGPAKNRAEAYRIKTLLGN